MAITFPCTCGKTLKVGDEHAGKRVRCPACNGAADVPAAVRQATPIVARPVPVVPARPAAVAKPKAVDDFEVVEDDEDPPPRMKKPSRFEEDRPSRRGSKRRDDDDDRPRKKSSHAIDDDEEDDRPRKKKKKPKKRQPDGAGAGKRTLAIVGGLVAVVAGIGLTYFLWDYGGRRIGKLLAIGLVLVFGGIGAVFNGLTGNFGDDAGEDRNDDDDDRDEDDD